MSSHYPGRVNSPLRSTAGPPSAHPASRRYAQGWRYQTLSVGLIWFQPAWSAPTPGSGLGASVCWRFQSLLALARHERMRSTIRPTRLCRRAGSSVRVPGFGASILEPQARCWPPPPVMICNRPWFDRFNRQSINAHRSSLIAQSIHHSFHPQSFPHSPTEHYENPVPSPPDGTGTVPVYYGTDRHDSLYPG